jgi:YidC/Oxa1 family membrane protein insertase
VGNLFNTILVYPLFNLLLLIYAYVHDFGLAIVILTVLIRLLVWPLVTKQLHSQRALQDLQPELAKIKEKAAGDRALEGQLTMELYKEREINPFASILPLLVQLPILFALFIVLKDIVKAGEIAKLAYDGVKHLPAVANIINGTTPFKPTFLGFINLTKPSIYLAILAGLVQFVQTKQLAPKQQSGDTQAQVMASMTYMFPALTFFIGLSLPGALPLYWATASIVAVIQQTIVLRRDVEELEEEIDATSPALPNPKKPASTGKKAKRRSSRKSAKGGSS